MTTRRFTFSNIVLYVLLFGIIFYIQHICVIEPADPFRMFNMSETIILFVILLLVGVWYFMYEYRMHGMKLNFPLAIILLVLFVIAVVMTLTFPESLELTLPTRNEGEMETVVVNVLMEQKILSIFVEFMALAFIYIFLAVLPQKIHATRQLNIVFYCTIIVTVAALIYSFVNEAEAYKAFFDNESIISVAVQSFTNNPNNYAMILMFGCISALFLHHTTHKFWWIIVAFFIYLMIFPSNCRTNLASCGIIFVGYCITRIVLSYKKHPYINSLIVFFVLFAVAVFVLGYYFYEKSEFTYNSKIFAKLHIYLVYFNDRVEVARQLLRQRAAVLFDQGYWVTGMGMGLFNDVYFAMNQSNLTVLTSSPHNGFYQTIGCGGWILLGFLTLTLLYLLWMMVRVFLRHKTITILTLLILLGFGFHLYTEAATPLVSSPPIADCFMMTLFTFVPIYSAYYHDCHSKINREMVEEANASYEKKIVFKRPFGIGQTISFFGVLSLGVVASLLPYFNFDLIWIIVCAGIFGLTFILGAGIELLLQRRQFNFVNYLKNILIPYLSAAVVYAGLVIGIQLLVEPTFLLTISLAVGVPFVYIGLFFAIPYFNNRVGVLLPTVDVLTRTYERQLAKRMNLCTKPDRFTLFEKVTRKITPPIFRNEL